MKHPLAAGLALALLAPPSIALACSCREVSTARATVPDDGARAFPTDGVVRVFVTAFPRALRNELAREYRLVDANGAAVPVTMAWVGTRLDLRPRAALRPNARYALERIYAYAPDGAQVSDTQRLDQLRDEAAGLRRVWFPEVRFETGAGPAARRAPGRVTLIGVQAGARHGGGDCGPGITLSTDFALPEGLPATDIVQFEVRGRGFAPMLAQTLPSAGAAAAYAGDLMCNPDPVVVPYRPSIEARVVVLDAAGATVASSPWTATTIATSRPISSTWGRDRRVADGPAELVTALRRGWTSPPIVSVAAATPAGPAACPFGLETVARRQLAPSGAQATYEDRSSLLVDGHRAWLALGAGDARSRFLALTPDATARPLGEPFDGPVAASALLDGGPLVVTRPSVGRSPHVMLRAFSAEGAPRWSAEVPPQGRTFQLAVGGGRALAVWRDERAVVTPRVGWGLFDARTGAVVGRAHESEHALDINGAPAVAWAGDRFLVAWPPPRARGGGRPLLLVAAVSSDGELGAPRALALASDGPPDLAAAGDHVALVAADEGVVRWALLGRDGAFARGPVTVSDGVGDGDNRKPRVTAGGGLFAVTWEAYSSTSLWAAVVDAGGAVSPALRLTSTRGGSTGVVAAGEERTFLAAYTVDYQRAWANALRCRTAASSGAPQRIASTPAPVRPPPL